MQKQHYLLDMAPQDRIQVLQDTADKIEETKYLRGLSSEDLDQKREELTEKTIQLADLKEEMKQVAAEFKARMDPVKEDQARLIAEVKTRQTEHNGIVYHLADHERGMMDTFDDLGELIGSRRLRPEEKQATLFVQQPANA